MITAHFSLYQNRKFCINTSNFLASLIFGSNQSLSAEIPAHPISTIKRETLQAPGQKNLQ
jgi:hypothetical protein